MSTYIIAQSTPLPGKVNLVETRMRTVLGVMAQKGAKETRLFRNLIGNMAGDFGMGAKFDNFHEALSTFDEVRHDPWIWFMGFITLSHYRVREKLLMKSV